MYGFNGWDYKMKSVFVFRPKVIPVERDFKVQFRWVDIHGEIAEIKYRMHICPKVKVLPYLSGRGQCMKWWKFGINYWWKTGYVGK